MEQAITLSGTPSKYVRDFEALFVPTKKTELRDKARNGQLRDSLFRSVCWRYFLHCLPEQYDQWLNSCREGRLKYESIRAKHSSAKQLETSGNQSTTPKPPAQPSTPSTTVAEPIKSNKTDLQDNHEKHDEHTPTSSSSDIAIKSKELDEEQQYIRATNQCDHKNVFRTIERDVVRTFPDMEFFRQTEMQNILENVLYNYASENPHLSYKQGMHELLAILLYVLHTDSQTCLITHEGGYANDTIATLLDRKYLEHDVFHLFSALMGSIETWYQNDEILSVATEAAATDAVASSKRENGELTTKRSGGRSSSHKAPVSSVLGVKLNMISENIVKNHDLELFNHLEALQIAPQIYGIRWMRLLFGREFEFLDLLTVWDALICDEVSMSLTEYIFASMLVTIREELVNGDYTDCLNNLMRHQFKDVQYVIKLALHLRDPKKFSRPISIKSSVGNQAKHYKKHSVQHDRYSPETSLTSKLSQQYISGKNQFQQITNKNNPLPTYHIQTVDQQQTRRYQQKMSPSNIDNRDSRRIFMTPKPQPIHRQLQGNRDGCNVDVTSGGTGNPSSNRPSGSVAKSSTNKFLPNLNKFVTSIGQNIQDKTNQQQSLLTSTNRSRPQTSSSQEGVQNSGRVNQHYHHRSVHDQLMVAVNPVKEYEMREMLSTSSGSIQRGQMARFPIGCISDPKNTLNLSTESYDDLHSIVDYCWRLLSEQIDSLQRCLPKEKSLHSEDEIFVALAQLKKVRDVLKGSLRLEDELDSPPGGSKS